MEVSINQRQYKWTMNPQSYLSTSTVSSQLLINYIFFYNSSVWLDDEISGLNGCAWSVCSSCLWSPVIKISIFSSHCIQESFNSIHSWKNQSWGRFLKSLFPIGAYQVISRDLYTRLHVKLQCMIQLEINSLTRISNS